MNLKDKIIAGLKSAAAFERGHPGEFKISNYHVRIKPGRAAITNTDTGDTRIVPVKN